MYGLEWYNGEVLLVEKNVDVFLFSGLMIIYIRILVILSYTSPKISISDVLAI